MKKTVNKNGKKCVASWSHSILDLDQDGGDDLATLLIVGLGLPRLGTRRSLPRVRTTLGTLDWPSHL